MPRTTIEFEVNDRNARVGFDRLQRELRETESGLQQTNRTARDTQNRFVTASRSADTFGKSLGGVRGILTGLGIAAAAREIISFGASSVRAAGQIEGLKRGLEAIEGENAIQRLRDFNEIAKLPGLNTPQISNSLRAAGAANTSRAMLQLIAVRTAALERENSEIQRYTQLLANAKAVAVGDTNPAIQQLERSLERSRATTAALTREIELLKNGFQNLVPADATQTTANHALALEKLKAAAEDTRRAFTETSETNPQLIPNFQATLTASNAYYAERIRQAETALAKEKAGTDAFNALQVEIFQLGRQQLAAQRTLETERTSVLRASTQERVHIEAETNNEIITGIRSVVRASREALQARVEFARQIAAIPRVSSAIPRVSSPDAQYGQFTAQLRADFQETERQARGLLGVIQQIVSFTTPRFDLDASIPDPDGHQQAIDERIAAEIRGQQTLNDIRQDALEQGRQFLSNSISSEERAVQSSLRKQARSYRQFANLVSNTFINLATGRAQSFEQVATAFVQQSLRIVLRAYVEFQVQKKLDDDLTASKIANLRKVSAAQQTGGLAGSLPGLANLPGIGNLGNLFSGGGLALGVSGLLFPKESSNLLGGIREEISGFLSNVAEVPDRAFGARQQVFLKIGENEVRDISDIQSELINEDRL